MYRYSWLAAVLVGLCFAMPARAQLTPLRMVDPKNIQYQYVNSSNRAAPVPNASLPDGTSTFSNFLHKIGLTKAKKPASNQASILAARQRNARLQVLSGQ